MITKTTFALALVLATASGVLAATKQHSVEPHNDAYSRGIYVGSDPDTSVRFELHRDADRGK